MTSSGFEVGTEAGFTSGDGRKAFKFSIRATTLPVRLLVLRHSIAALH